LMHEQVVHRLDILGEQSHGGSSLSFENMRTRVRPPVATPRNVDCLGMTNRPPARSFPGTPVKRG
jgi:hypothetical protein